MIKSSPYTLLVKSYPQPISSLRLIVDKDISAFTTVCLSFIVYVMAVLNSFSGQQRWSRQSSYRTRTSMVNQEVNINLPHPWPRRNWQVSGNR